jgi:hypothetical protein
MSLFSQLVAALATIFRIVVALLKNNKPRIWKNVVLCVSNTLFIFFKLLSNNFADMTDF